MNPHASTPSRLETLERQVAELSRQLSALGGRSPTLASPPVVRLAKTTTSSTYPEKPANTFEIKFLDGAVDTWAAGEQTPTYTPRSASAQAVAHVIGGHWIPEDTVVRVVELGRRWWIIDRCCAECRVFSASGEIEANYTTEAGTWDDSGGKAETSSDDATLISIGSVGVGDGLYLQAEDVTASASGDKVRFYIGWQDADNTLYAEIEFGTTNSTLRLFERVDGDDTQLGSNVTLSGLAATELVRVQVCAGGTGIFTAIVFESGILRGGHTSITATPLGQKAGIGTGALTGTAEFGTVTFERRHAEELEDCPECLMTGCPACEDGFAPVQLLIEVSDWPADACGCTLNGSYIVPLANFNLCRYNLTIFESGPCVDSCGGDVTLDRVAIVCDLSVSGGITVRFAFAIDPNSCPQVSYRLLGELDCRTLDHLEIPYFTQGSSCFPLTPKFDGIDLSDVVVKVTAL